MANTSEENKAPSLLSEVLRAELRDIVKEAVQAASQNGHQEGDHLLDAEKAAEILSVGEDWLYRHHKKLPFTRKLGPKMLRFSYQGIQRYLSNRKTS